MEINKVGVLGCGLMGHGITQICAQTGWEVVVREVDQGRSTRASARSRSSSAGGREGQGRAGRRRRRARADPGTLDYARPRRLRPRDRGDHRGPRREARDVAGGGRDRQGRGLLRHQHLLAAGRRPGRGDRRGRALPRAALLQPRPGDAAARGRPAEGTTDEAYDLGFEVGEELGKTTVAAGDNRGFIVNRLLVPYMLDAIRAHEQGVGSIEDIDAGMMAGASHPMGPLTLADFVGLDTLASIADVMVDAYGEDRFAAPDTLRKMVDAGEFGRKSGKGFYDYSGEKPVPDRSGRTGDRMGVDQTASTGSATRPSRASRRGYDKQRGREVPRAARRLARDRRRGRVALRDREARAGARRPADRRDPRRRPRSSAQQIRAEAEDGGASDVRSEPTPTRRSAAEADAYADAAAKTRESPSDRQAAEQDAGRADADDARRGAEAQAQPDRRRGQPPRGRRVGDRGPRQRRDEVLGEIEAAEGRSRRRASEHSPAERATADVAEQLEPPLATRREDEPEPENRAPTSQEDADSRRGQTRRGQPRGRRGPMGARSRPERPR